MVSYSVYGVQKFLSGVLYSARGVLYSVFSSSRGVYGVL